MIWNKEIKKRIIGSYGDITDPKLMIVMGGVHGNEKAGIQAIEDVMYYLQENQTPIRGCFFGIKGNLKASEKAARYIDTDLNRLWYDEQLDKVRNLDKEFLNAEEIEQKEIDFILHQLLSHREATSPFIFIDLHTTSSPQGFFTIVNDNVKALDLAEKLHVPVVSGLTSVLKNTTLDMFSKKEMAGIAFEAGQHDDPQSIERMKAYLMLALHSMDMIALTVYEIDTFHKLLLVQSNEIPVHSSFFYRHSITPQDQFEMKPNFTNFDPITKGQVLATDKNGDVKAVEDGYILMPLYQKQGTDGFFIVK